MVYDGEMIKYSGVKTEPITWKGSLGILAGGTPSIYAHFEEVADMGERFIYYRMKPYDVEKATRRSLNRNILSRELDQKLSKLYEEYIKESILNVKEIIVPEISPLVYERIVKIAMLAAVLRTPTHYDKFSRTIDKVPISEMPMRVALQLSALARGLSVMEHYDNGSWELSEEDIGYIEWCAYSLANEERRMCLKTLAQLDYGDCVSGQNIADQIGLATTITSMNLQHLAAIGILTRSGGSNGLNWAIKDKNIWEIIRRLEGIKNSVENVVSREISNEEMEEKEAHFEEIFKNIF